MDGLVVNGTLPGVGTRSRYVSDAVGKPVTITLDFCVRAYGPLAPLVYSCILVGRRNGGTKL